MSSLSLYPAYVLHRRRYRDSSLLLDMFSEKEGRFSAIAKGVLGGRRATAGLLQPFIPLLVGWRGKGEVKSLAGIEPAGYTPPALSGNALYCGFYVNELLSCLLQPHLPLPELFAFYGATLSRLASGEPYEPLLRHFEVVLLDYLGVGLQLEQEADGITPIRHDKRYYYRIEQGALSEAAGEETILGATLLALARQEWGDPVIQREARHLMRRVLAHYLGGRRLKSRELFRGK